MLKISSEKEHRLKGAFHLHSDYSHDSSCSLEELVQKARKLGYSFLVITDHFEDMDKSRLQELIDNCKRLTMASDNLEIIPGIEIRCKNRAHILVIGIQAPIDPSDALDIELVQKSAKAQGALTGVAHLCHEANLSLEELSGFDFIEVWNARYDKKFPSLKNLRIAQRVPNSCILGGVDSHSIDRFGSLWIETEIRNVIEAIKQKKVVTKSSLIALDSHGYIGRSKAAYYTLYLSWLSVRYLAHALGQIFVLTRWSPPHILKKVKRNVVG